MRDTKHCYLPRAASSFQLLSLRPDTFGLYLWMYAYWIEHPEDVPLDCTLTTNLRVCYVLLYYRVQCRVQRGGLIFD